jgi:hypothetical protein
MMMTEYQLPEEYAQMGFYISGFGRNSMALKHSDRTIFVFNTGTDMRDDFVRRLCECYVRIVLEPFARV